MRKRFEILEGIPEHLRDTSFYRKSVLKRDRVLELDQIIRKAVQEVRVESFRPQVEELLELQPQRKDLQKLLERFPKAPLRPKHPPLSDEPLMTICPTTVQVQELQSAWAEHLRMDVEVTNSLGMQFRVIPPGTFEMGSSEDEEDRRADEQSHTVRLTQPKLLGVYPVTQSEWTKVMGSNPSHFKKRKLKRHPVFRWRRSVGPIASGF